jgi:hypothetical protein
MRVAQKPCHEPSTRAVCVTSRRSILRRMAVGGSVALQPLAFAPVSPLVHQQSERPSDLSVEAGAYSLFGAPRHHWRADTHPPDTLETQAGAEECGCTQRSLRTIRVVFMHSHRVSCILLHDKNNARTHLRSFTATDFYYTIRYLHYPHMPHDDEKVRRVYPHVQQLLKTRMLT